MPGTFKTKVVQDLLSSVILSVIFLWNLPCRGGDLEEFKGCSFVKVDWADGDSFLVKLPDEREIVLRLYFVDCIERVASDITDKRRLREQSRYFGLNDIKIAINHGELAAKFTAEKLKEPFTVFTSWAAAMGRTAKPRYYAFIKTREGHDLAEQFVENGLARVVGIGRETPDGTRRDDREDFLEDLQLAAAIQGKGVWAFSSPDLIVSMREEERVEMRGLELIGEAMPMSPPSSPINVNSASLEAIMSCGVSAKIADEIVKRRPFASFEELDDVKGIGPVTLEKIRPFLKVVTSVEAEPES